MVTSPIPPKPICVTTSWGPRRWQAESATLSFRITAQYVASLKCLMHDLGVWE
jgi:hypothetical protein